MSAEQKEKFEALKREGNEKFAAKNYANAIKSYTKAIEVKNDEAVAYSNRAACHNNLEQYYNALDDCNKALKLDENLVKGYYRRATALKELSRFKLAREDFSKVLELDPTLKSVEDELKEIDAIIREDTRVIAKTYEKPAEFKSKLPKQKFKLNNKYVGTKMYTLST